MHLNTRVLLLPALFVISVVLAQQTASPTSGSPAVAYPANGACVFCSSQDCTGTCEVVNTDNLESDEESAPNGMDFRSIYWHDPGNYGWTPYACAEYYTCYNLYDNGVPTDFYEFYHLLDG